MATASPEPSFGTLKSAQQKTLTPKKGPQKLKKRPFGCFIFVGHPHMFKQPDPQGFLQHALTQSRYAWDHATWALHNQHHSQLLQVSHQIHLDGPN